MSRKKIVFVIVEGPSDEEALGAFFGRFFDKNSVFVQIMRTDITTSRGNTENNIVSKVGEVVRRYAASNHFSRSDFQEIIHITDTDGAFIPDDCIIEDADARDPIYSNQFIRTRSRKGIVLRNEQKRENLGVLSRCYKVWGLPYRVYYMSVNLDHVLYNKLNSTDREKEKDSHAFVKRYRNDLPAFIDYISASDFSVTSGYRESWDYIREGRRSLERHSNLGLCFKRTACTEEEKQ